MAPRMNRSIHQILSNDKLSQYQDPPLSRSKADYEMGVPGPDVQPGVSRPAWTYSTLLKLVGCLSIALLVQRSWSISSPFTYESDVEHASILESELCPQVDSLPPSGYENLLYILDREYGSDDFKTNLYDSLGGAIRICSESYDDPDHPPEDPRWEVVIGNYIQARFPNINTGLKRTVTDTYALVYEWEGTDAVKPLLISAHLDVVPVDPKTEDEWIYPPYSGYYDGEWVWGRGSCDDKARVIGSLAAIETLLKHGFVPSRKIILAFGIDEETGGDRGAASIAKYLLDAHGPNSLAMILDEGGEFTDRDGVVFATPAVTEKGYLDVRMDVLAPGGHSSLPPKHTGIGVLSDLITTLEANPHRPVLIRGRTYYQGLECRAKYDKGFPVSMRRLLRQSQTSDKKLKDLENHLVDSDQEFYALSGTTQAVDLIGGGVKVNALPEASWSIVNHRIADHSSVAEVMDRFTEIAIPVAARHNMTLDAFGENAGEVGPLWGSIHLSVPRGKELQPAPVTPTTGSGPYILLSGTIRSTFGTHLRTDNLPKYSVIAPGLMTPNTDSHHYWDLTKHIFRYGHRGVQDTYNGIHTVNEAFRAEGFLEQVRFFTRLILNADKSELLE